MRRISLLLTVFFLRAGTAYGQPIVCTNANADTDNIAAAINQVCNNGGGEVLLPPTTCAFNPVSTNAPFHLCSNLTIRGVGPKSVLRVIDGGGSYITIFASPVGAPFLVSNVVMKDFKVDQNPIPSGGNGLPEHLHVINLPATSGGVTGITVSGMSFDQTDGVHTLHLENNTIDGLRATITNNYFNFVKAPGGVYDNTAVYLEGSLQVVTGNTFLSGFPSGQSNQFAGTGIETHGGRASISNNTTNNYATLVKVGPTSSTITPALSPTDVVVSNNAVTCAKNGVVLAGVAGRTIQNVSVTGNTIQICNVDRFAQANPTVFSGIRYDLSSAGDVDGLAVSDNVVAMQAQTSSASYSSNSIQNNGGIVLHTQGLLANVLVSGNIVTNSPVSGIRIGSSASGAVPPVQRVRITENTIVDAGNAGIPSTNPDYYYRHAIGLFGFVKEVDIMRNMINDTRSDTALATYGYYALYLNQASNSTNIRTSQNTVRVAAPATQTGQPTVLPTFQGPNGGGLVDVTNANDVLISTIQGSAGLLPVVDFMSFTRYITTITGQSGSQLTLTVPSPPVDTGGAYVQWTVGQLVTFRFICPNTQGGGCLVTFDPPYAGLCETPNCMNANLPITSSTGRAITFAVESLSSTGRRFFELYRSPTGVAN